MKSRPTGPRQTRPSRSKSPSTRTTRQTSRTRTSGVTNISQERYKRMTEAERAKYRHKKRMDKLRRDRIRRLKQIRAILILLAIIFVISSIVRALSKDKDPQIDQNHPSQPAITEEMEGQEEDQTETPGGQEVQRPVEEPKGPTGFSPNIQGYVQTISATNLYEAPETNAESTQIPVGTYLPQYGHVGGWIKVYQKGKAGYVQASNIKEASNDTTFFVKNGVLLVNRQYTLPADFDPGLLPETKNAFDEMKAAAKKDGISLAIGSGYRSYEYQVEVHDRLVADSGETRANQVSAQPGHSEHQTGLALDIIGADPSTNITQTFHDTKEAKWLQNNAYKYGFHLRYMEGKENITGYEYESWHYRYLGKDLATQLFLTGQCLEEYLGVAQEQPEIFQETVGISMDGEEEKAPDQASETEQANP